MTQPTKTKNAKKRKAAVTAPESGAADISEGAELRLLDAGYQMLCQGTPLTAIKLKPLTEAAELSSGAFYHTWPSMLDYYRDLARHALKPENSAYIFDMKRELDELDPQAVSLEQVCMLYGAFDSRAMEDDQAFHAAVSLWGLRNHPGIHGVKEALGDSYGEFAQTYVEMYGSLLEKYGLQLRPPFTLKFFAATLTALTEGMSLRRAVDPEALALPDDLAEAGWESLGFVIYALLAAAVMPADSPDPRTVVDFTSDILALSGSKGDVNNALASKQLRVELAERWRLVQQETEELDKLLQSIID